MKNKAIFKVETIIELSNVEEMELNNSEVLHPDVIEALEFLVMTGLAQYEITLDEVLEFDEEEVTDGTYGIYSPNASHS